MQFVPSLSRFVKDSRIPPLPKAEPKRVAERPRIAFACYSLTRMHCVLYSCVELTLTAIHPVFYAVCTFQLSHSVLDGALDCPHPCGLRSASPHRNNHFAASE